MFQKYLESSKLKTGEDWRGERRDSLEGVYSISQLEHMQQFVVDSDWDGEANDGQGESGHHSDDAQLEQSQQSHHQPCEHHPCPLHILPVDQVHYYMEVEKGLGYKTSSLDYKWFPKVCGWQTNAD